MSTKSKRSAGSKNAPAAAKQPRAQDEYDGGWASLFNLELEAHKVPTSPIARTLFNWRVWFEATFVFTLLEPWEKVLLVTIATVLFSLFFVGVWKYLPYHVVFLYHRAMYYLLGQETASFRPPAIIAEMLR